MLHSTGDCNFISYKAAFETHKKNRNAIIELL